MRQSGTFLRVVVVCLSIIFVMERPLHVLLFSSDGRLFLPRFSNDCRPCHSFGAPRAALHTTPVLTCQSERLVARKDGENSVNASCAFGGIFSHFPHFGDSAELFCYGFVLFRLAENCCLPFSGSAEGPCLRWRSTSISESCSQVGERWRARRTGGSIGSDAVAVPICRVEGGAKSERRSSQCSFDPTPTCGRELWGMTKRT